MFANRRTPDGLLVFGAMREFRTAKDMQSRLRLVRRWTEDEGIEVLLLDIASDFFRGENDNPTDERAVAGFFEQLRDIAGMTWISSTELAHFLDALDDILGIQANMCRNGVDHRINPCDRATERGYVVQ